MAQTQIEGPPVVQIDVKEDCRCIFPPLCKLKPVLQEEPVIRIQKVELINGKFESNPLRTTADDFAKGIAITCTAGVKLAQNYFLVPNQHFRPQPACFVTLQLPYSLRDDGVMVLSRPGAVPGAIVLTGGYQPFILDAEVKVVGNVIHWNPSPSSKPFLSKVFGRPRADITILASLTLKGNYIWNEQANSSLPMYLDGESFGDPTGENPTGLVLPQSGDGHRGGDFEMWFWLVKEQ